MKIAAVTPHIHIADCAYNADQVLDHVRNAYEAGCDAAVFPAFVLTGSTCGDLFASETLRKQIETALIKIKDESVFCKDMLIAAGFPAYKNLTDHVESCIAVIRNGVFEVFISGNTDPDDTDDNHICIDGTRYLFEYDDIMEPVIHKGEKISFITDHFSRVHERFVPDISVCMCNHELYAGSVNEELEHLTSLSRKGNSEYICVSTGAGESGDECVYSGLKAYVSNGMAVDFSLKCGMCIYDTEHDDKTQTSCTYPDISFDNAGFLPENEDAKELFCLDIMKIQARGLGERLKYLHMKKCIIGLSGGLDSALALVAAVNAFDRYGMDRKDIICVTMPGFGTGKTTKSNAISLADVLGVTLLEIDIKDQVSLHLKSIGQPFEYDREGHETFKADITFENAQARTRTMILLDIANKENAIVVGTGDMSELALGWCTYNGDHMSNYSVNAGVPKTVIAPVLRTFANRVAGRALRDRISDILENIIDTPVSPELLPAGEDGTIAQKTEDSLGPYELHDFFLYQFLYRNKTDIKDLYLYALNLFGEKYGNEIIFKTFKTFIKRFFTQQFKRSCLPVGPKVFKYCLSPRSGFLMPSDAYSDIWIRELEAAAAQAQTGTC